jgi:peptide/nickel transport system substrate-binding protein/oligopeptide transport system substrate-binding protein
MLKNTIKKLLFGVIFVIYSACQSSPVQPPPPQEEKEESTREFVEARPPVFDRDELTVVFSKHNIEFDTRKSYFASEAQIFTGIYEGLFSYHPLTLEPVLAAAQRWELSEDKKQWTFTIRQNARFWNGDPVRAEDFRAAWISLLEPERGSPYSSLFDIIEGARDFRNGIEKDPANVGIIASDEKTLIVRLNSPASFFPAMLCHHSFAPIHHSMIDKNDWSKETIISNGPFRIESKDEDKIVLIRNNHYWDRRRVELNRIIIKFTESADEASALWNSGEARWIAGDVNIEMLTDHSGIQVNVMFATHYYFIRSAEKPWNDYRLRRAMALVLPWEEIRGGFFLPAETLIFPIAGYPKVEGITEADYEEAERLMNEAGLSGGVGVPELVIRITPSREAARIAAIMATTWREKLGLNPRVEVIPFDRYFQSLKEDDFIIGSSTWIGDFADPYTFLQMWRRDSNLNDARYNDPDFEYLIERSMFEEGYVRLATLAQAEKLLLDRGTVLPIAYSPAVNIVDTNELSGWFPNALDIHPFKYLAFKNFRPLPGVAMGIPQGHVNTMKAE